MAKIKKTVTPPETVVTPVSPSPEEHQRYVCVHGHFYQPPRENPWLETVEVQESAHPYHDWNERITAECYSTNGASRIVNSANQIVRITNNYSRMSFNFGPTLLSWLADFAPLTYRTILDADRISADRFSGHGSAMAQVYNHIIMPLANDRDCLTQIRWGKTDFRFRFGRDPEGMWLAETAANRRVLDMLAQEGIKFTVLAPAQCARVRVMTREGDPEAEWFDTKDAKVDPTRPYLVKLDEGRTITVFFYDGPVSRAVAFEGLLNSGETFANRVVGSLPQLGEDDRRPQLAHIATDGESYGHHHRHGEMALTYAFHYIEQQGLAKLTNYGEFLEKFPPTWEAEIFDNTSWSCAHGVERWRSNCGCNTGRAGWNQEWRAPLRDALDYVRDNVNPLAEEYAKPYLKDLWAARDAYVHVVLNRSPENIHAFFHEHATRELTAEERIRMIELLELQRHTQLMYTSCGWFFDEISGIETVQIIAYAGRVLQLAYQLFGEKGKALEGNFLEILKLAKSNIAEMGDGAQVYRRWVLGMRVGLEQVGAHYAISSIFRSYPEEGSIFCYDIRRQQYRIFSSGRGKVAVGTANVRSRVTGECETVAFAVLHLGGDQNLSAAVRAFAPDEQPEFDAFTTAVSGAMAQANLPDVIRNIDSFFDNDRSLTSYSLRSLFSDEQHRILQSILTTTLSEVEESLRRIYQDHASLLHFIRQSNMPTPPALALTANFALNAAIRNAVEAEPFNSAILSALLEQALTDEIQLDSQVIGYSAGKRMHAAMEQLRDTLISEAPSLEILQLVTTMAECFRQLPFEVRFWDSQNVWNYLLDQVRNDPRLTEAWQEGYGRLGVALGIAVDELVVEEGVGKP
ncbi:DUF3536 domain-containing protein [Terriglobus tenax]|uniref:DUF3536 domain-containing protein n=1 Tax=Terriglobus tenax TaxID=1111115 RepID=UPI0021E06F8B|nr:DUF3536 domain-containing protein [Terriglobus tenax]